MSPRDLLPWISLLAMLSSVGCDPPEPARPADGGEAIATDPASEVTNAADQAAASPSPDPVGVDDPDDDVGSDDPVAPPPDEPPPDWGSIKPPVPPPEASALTVHGLAGYEVVAVYTQPDLESPRLGYLRFGQRMMVTPKIDDAGEGCPKGFHALPAGGFACASKGLLVDEAKAPYMHMPPPPPRADAPLPYDYGKIAKDGTAMWWRTADRDEVMLAQAKYDAQVAALAPPDDGTGTPEPADTESPEPGEATPPPLTEEEREAARLRAEERAAELAEKAAKLPLHVSKPFMEQGFIITLGEKVRDKGRPWWRTTRGGFVEAAKVWRKKIHDFEGGELPEGSGFPFGFVMQKNASASTLQPSGKLKWSRKLRHRELLAFTNEVQIGSTSYLVTADGLHVRAADVRVAEPQPRPASVRQWEKWIDVSLERQILVAYSGDTPVYATLVSTGKKGTDEESFETPAGEFRIVSKHISSSMDGTTASDGNYSIQDVPWTMFFKDSYALHGAFWHSSFGRKRSHGCVNLGPTDAHWLFDWTVPHVPEGWHGVRAHDGAPGTLVVVH